MKYIAPEYIFNKVEAEDVLTVSPGIFMGPEDGLGEGEARVEVDINQLF